MYTCTHIHIYTIYTYTHIYVQNCPNIRLLLVHLITPLHLSYDCWLLPHVCCGAIAQPLALF